jgi:large conductance mechanosensitive channel
MSFVKEFRDFAVRGNVVDMAVGIIIGAAFGKIVASMVSDILMPLIGLVTGGIDFKGLFYALDGKQYESIEAAKAAGVGTVNYGLFITTVIDFVIIAFVIFVMIRQMNKLKKAAPPPPPPNTRDCPRCLMPIPIAASRCGHCTADLKPA